MWEKTLTQRFILIGAVLLIAIWFIYPPQDKLRGGLDIEGGVSMIFEIEEEEGVSEPYLAEQMKRLLQKRVDPKGIYDLKWRVLGRNRLEVQMPLPPEGNKRLKQDYIDALDDLLKTNVRPSQLEKMCQAGDERETLLVELAAGDAERERLMREVAARFDEYVQAQAALAEALKQSAESEGAPEESQPAAPTPAETQPAATAPASQPSERELRLQLRDATEAWDDAMEAVLDTNLDDRRFQEVLEMEARNPRRESSLKDLYERYPLLKDQIQQVVEKHGAWREKRAFLEGPADLRRLLRGAGVLEFRLLAEPSPENPTKYDRYREQLAERGPRPTEGDPYQWFRIDNPLAFFSLDSPVELRDFEPRMAEHFVVDQRDETWYVLSKRGPQDGLLHTKTGGHTRQRRPAGRRVHARPGRRLAVWPVDGRQHREAALYLRG
jgi:SecD/SecF fusion protein